jgi:hypothetical protein
MIEYRQTETDAIFSRYAGDSPATNAAPVMKAQGGELTQADEILLDKIIRSRQDQKFQKLFMGDWQGDYESQSEADLALCSILAFWSKKDPEQIDRIFCQSKLYREKWDEQHGRDTYGEMTIGRAIAHTETVYGENQAPSRKTYSTRGVFELIQAGKLEDSPSQWLVRNLVELDSLALVFGDPGCCKSFWAIALALCVATGTEFFGHKVRQGPVIFIAGEGGNGLRKRMVAWSLTAGIRYDTAPLFVSRKAAALTVEEIVDQVEAAIETVLAEHGPPVLIVIDTVARNFGPGDENSTQDMSQFIQAADALRAISQATVLLVHHTGHGDKSRARGAMALKGALDAEYRLDKDESGVVRLEATKMKESKHPEPEAYRIKSVELPLPDDEGEPQYSAVLESTSYAPPPQKGKAGQGKHQVKALQILKDLQAEGRRLCVTEGRDPATARISLDAWKKSMKADGIPAQRVSEVISALRGNEMITGKDGYVSLLPL